jgi:hypothetical protein
VWHARSLASGEVLQRVAARLLAIARLFVDGAILHRRKH